MARQLEHFDNLVAMFLTRAEEKGDAAVPVGQARRASGGRSAGREAARQVAALAAIAEAHRARSPATACAWSARTGPNG